MKYIVVELTQEGLIQEMPFIFPEAMVHSEMYALVERALLFHNRHRASARCVGAGFISCRDVAPRGGCYGESESLKIKSRGVVDDRLIQMMDYMQGIKT